MPRVGSRVNLKGAKTRRTVTANMFRKLLCFLQIYVMILKDENWARFSICIVSPSDKACWQSLVLLFHGCKLQDPVILPVWCVGPLMCLDDSIYEVHLIVSLWLMGVEYMDLDLEGSEKDFQFRTKVIVSILIR